MSCFRDEPAVDSVNTGLIHGFQVNGLIPAILAAIVTGVISWIGHILIGDATRDRR